MTESRSSFPPAFRVAGTLVLALFVSVLPLAPPASAQVPAGRDITEPPDASSCPVDRTVDPATTEVPEDGFTDVGTDNVHEFAIDCVAWYGVTSGTSETTYEPGGTVQRAQAASFIARFLDYAGDEDHAGAEGPGTAVPAAPADNQFPCDVSPTDVHYENVQRLAAARVIEGTGTNDEGEGCFDPGANVSRGQIASMLWRALGYTDDEVRALPDVDLFSDDDGDVHEGSINSLGVLGIAQGTATVEDGPALYSPGLDHQRDQAATLLARALDLLVEEGLIVPPPTE